MSSEKFEYLEEDIKATLDELQHKQDVRLTNAAGEERKRLLWDVEKGVDELNKMLCDAESEAFAAPPQFRQDMITKIRSYREATGRISNRLKKNANMSDSAYSRESLFGDSADHSEGMSHGRTRVLAGTGILGRTSDSIARSHTVAIETEEVGHGIINDLAEQREALGRTRERLGETDEELGRSKKIIKSIYRRLFADKFILIGIIILEVIGLFAVIYWKYLR